MITPWDVLNILEGVPKNIMNKKPIDRTREIISLASRPIINELSRSLRLATTDPWYFLAVVTSVIYYVQLLTVGVEGEHVCEQICVRHTSVLRLCA